MSSGEEDKANWTAATRKLFTRKDRVFFSLCLGSLFDYFQVRSMGYFMIEGICEKRRLNLQIACVT